MNQLTIIGNLTANPQVRTVSTQNGERSVCEFTVAANSWAGGKQTAQYIRVSVWEKAAENAMKYLGKGSKVAVSGPVTARAYLGDDGKARASLEIRNVATLEYLSTRREETTEEPGGGYAPIDEPDATLPF